MDFNRAELKQGVRLSMKGATTRPMLVTLLFTVAVSAGTWLINTVLGWMLTGGVGSISATVQQYILQGYDVDYAVHAALLELLSMGAGAIFGAVVGGSVLSILVALWQGVMNVGYEGYCLSMVRNEDPPMGKIFGALSQFIPVFITRFLTGVFMCLWGLLVALGDGVLLVVMGLLAALTESVLLTMLLMLAAVAWLVLGILWISVRYALVDYVLLDKGLSGMEAIRENKRLMQGNIGRAFKLQLSFAGWYLLMFVIVYAAVFAFVALLAAQVYSGSANPVAIGAMMIVLLGVAPVAIIGLWLRPYITGSMAKFYDWTQGRTSNVGPGPGFGGGSDGGWGRNTDYTWSSGAGSGSGTGVGPGQGNGSGPRPNPPKPRDDPWN